MNKTTDINATKAAIESCTHVRHIDAVEKMIVAFQIKWELENESIEVVDLYDFLNGHKINLIT